MRKTTTPASSQGKGYGKTITGLVLTIEALRSLFYAAAGTLRTWRRARAERKRARNGLQGLNDHVLRDVGLLRDRFTGTLLNDCIGGIPDAASRDAAEKTRRLLTQTVALREDLVERRQANRRIGDRRMTRRQLSSPKPQRPDPDQEAATAGRERRAYERRISDCGVLDCRRRFA